MCVRLGRFHFIVVINILLILLQLYLHSMNTFDSIKFKELLENSMAIQKVMDQADHELLLLLLLCHYYVIFVACL